MTRQAVSRRKFFHRAASLSGVALAPSVAGLSACSVGAAAALPVRRAQIGFGSYGPLRESSDCPELLIPDGFRVVKVSGSGKPSLADPTFRVPIAFDGMAAFDLPNDRIRLVRNHEVRDAAGVSLPFGPNPYDPSAGGGTTTVEIIVHRDVAAPLIASAAAFGTSNTDKSGGVVGIEVVREFPSLTGTSVNCAGGPTPWGAWLSCEETTVGPAAGFAKDHGYIFEVPVIAEGPVYPRPLDALGRFVHEAVAVDPRTGFLYETEDVLYDPGAGLPGAGFYRFLPNARQHLDQGGTLQVLRVLNGRNFDTTVNQNVGHILPVDWVDIDDADPSEAEADPSCVFRQGLEKGAAIFQRLEGCFYGDQGIFINATTGGNAGTGQVWHYRPRGGRRHQLVGGIAGTLTLVFESPNESVLKHPDNLTVSPRGGVVICEDSGGVQFLRGLTRRGEIFDLVRTADRSTEFAGATFGGDGDILFFNIQGSTFAESSTPGFTFAMWGPWERGAL